jgi:sugar phosphate permease
MKNLFRGWWMVAAGTGLQFLQSSLLHQSFGAYFAVLRDDRGWSKTELAGAAALHQVESAILGPVLGWFLDRFGPGGLVRIGVVMFGGGFMLLSQIDSLLAFYAAFLVTATGASMCGFFPLNFALIHWFERKRARAMASMQFGHALGGLSVGLVAWMLASYGWRVTAFASGVLIVIAGWPLAGMVRGKPADFGLRPDGEAPPPPLAPGQAAQEEAGRDFTAREALRTSAFWLLSLGHGFALFVVLGVNVHAITHLKEGLGYTIEQAALVIMLQTVFQVLGVGIGAWIGDRYDKRWICAVCMLMHMSGLLFLTYSTATWMLVAFAALHGTGWGLRGPFMQAIRADYFGRAAIGMILGLSFAIIVIGQIGGPLIAGIMADMSGNYRSGFTTLALLAGIGSVFFLMAKKPVRPARIS